MALAGDHLVVRITDSADALRQFIPGSITSIDLGNTFDQHDVTGMGDLTHKVINGQLKAPVTIKGFMTTEALNVTDNTVGTHTILQPNFEQGNAVTLRVAVGNNAPPVAGTSPEFVGLFLIESYKLMFDTGKAITFEAALKPAQSSAPTWVSMI
jgi:hypothetical protein